MHNEYSHKSQVFSIYQYLVIPVMLAHVIQPVNEHLFHLKIKYHTPPSTQHRTSQNCKLNYITHFNTLMRDSDWNIRYGWKSYWNYNNFEVLSYNDNGTNHWCVEASLAMHPYILTAIGMQRFCYCIKRRNYFESISIKIETIPSGISWSETPPLDIKCGTSYDDSSIDHSILSV